VYTLYQQDFNLWRVSGPTSEEVVKPTLFAASNRTEHMPVYSPDGSKVAFISDQLGDPEVWRSNADGSEPQKLTNVAEAWMAEWSPSGDRIAFSASEEGDGIFDIHVISDTGGAPRNLTPDEFQDTAPSWSPDGNWIYYASFREGVIQICRVPAEGGPSKQLTKKGGNIPRVTESGQVLFWRDETIWSLSKGGGDETPVLEKKIAWFNKWCIWKESIVYLSREASQGEMFNLTSGETTELPSLVEGWWLTVSPDGKWILYTNIQASGDLMLVENFY
jgi:Tol biopolymer transport system component